MRSYVIIGLGLFGTQIACRLYDRGQEVLVIDQDRDKIEQIADRVSRAVVADAKDREVLQQLGVHRYDCAVVAMTADVAATAFVTMNLKALKVPEIICKARSDADRELLEGLGVSRVIIPERMAGDRLCSRLLSNNVVDFIDLSDEHSIVEVHVPAGWQGRSIREADVRARHGVTIIALRQNGHLRVSPPPDTVLDAGTILVLLGENKALSRLQRLR